MGWKALRSGRLISFEPAARQPLGKVFVTGLLSNVLNPKPGLFVLAFLPQSANASRGSMQVQMGVYGLIFAVLTAGIFSLMGWLRLAVFEPIPGPSSRNGSGCRMGRNLR